MNITALFHIMFILFVALAAGYISGKTGVIDVQVNKNLSTLIFMLLNPVQILASVMTGDRLLGNRELLLLTLVAAGCYIILILVSMLIPQLLRTGRKDAGLYRFMFIFSNTGFIGYPVAHSLFGPSAVFYVSIFVLFFQLLCWSYGVQIVSGNGRFHWYWGILKSPCVIAALIAYFIYLTGIRFPVIISDSANFIGDVTPPLAMLVIGSSLSRVPLRQVFGNWRIYILFILKMIVMPIMVHSVLSLIIKNELILGVTTVILCMPVATNAIIISHQNGADENLAASGTFISTLLSIVTIPLVIMFLFG